MNYDNSWIPEPSNPSYPPLPPPTRDETAFLEEIAAIGEAWPQIMNERSLRAEAIENRISNARLEASLPQFESFGFNNPPPPAASSSSHASTFPTKPPQNNYQPYRPETQHNTSQSFLPPAPLPPPSSFYSTFQLPSSNHSQQQTRSQQSYISQNDQRPPLAMPRDYSNEGTGSGQFDRVWRSDSGAGIAQGSTRQPTIHEQQSQNKVLPWWEVPEQQQQMGPPQIYRQSPSQQLRTNLDFSDRPLAVSQNSHLSQSTFPSHSHLQRDQPRYRPFPPSIPPPLSQLPYQPPSREWNQALPTSYSTWEHSDVNAGLLPVEHHYESPSASSTGSGNLVPAGLTYATSSTSQSTDHSRQSSYVDFNSANEQLLSSTISNVAGIGKRTRFDSANYSRPPLNPQPHLSDTPSSSNSLATASSSSSSSLPTTASLDISQTSVSPPLSRDLNKSAGPTTTALPTSIPPTRRGNKTKVDVPISCISCGQKLARLILRGQKHELEVPYEATFTCLSCSNSAESGGGGGGSGIEESPGGQSVGSSERSPSYSPHVGTSSRRTSIVSTSASTPTSTSNSTAPPATFRKKNKRLDAGQATLTACDVCLMDRAKGSVLPREPEKGHSIDFQIEVVCVSCDEKYQRCSDCGGGGGVRLGTGKWRSKELFKDGKKTCSLRHQRLGAFPEMEYQVWKNTDIPRDELEEVSEKCGEMFTNQMLGAIAIPEVLERNGAIWTSYEEAKTHAYIGWKGMDPMIRYDIEPSQGIRRYLALRLCAPNLRKTTRKADLPPQREVPRTGQIFKGDKEIVGYIIAEWDMQRGVLFLALVIPWDATGEAYDATTLLLQALCARVQRDQREENHHRSLRGQPLLPKVERVFTMLFFKTGSRMITQLTKKRGFAPIDEYLQANPSADPLAFPPHRPIYLAVERQRGWLILVRTLRENADGTLDDWSARRSPDEERGKRKEARAKALREKKEKEKGNSNDSH
ncbi:hypothetical protein JCM5350_006941 [Sporobolomyces pararoseus]